MHTAGNGTDRSASLHWRRLKRSGTGSRCGFRGIWRESDHRGIRLEKCSVDSEIRIGDTVRLKVTQIGKECHSHCAIYRRMGDCIMPREGIFAEVLEGGNICVGDSVEVRMPQANRPYSTAVITLSDKAFAGEQEKT